MKPNPITKPLYATLYDSDGDIIIESKFRDINEISRTVKHYKNFHKITVKKVKIHNTF